MRSSAAWMLTAVLSLGMVGPASAQLTRTTPDCDYWMGINVLNQFNPTAQACAGAFLGNDTQLVGAVSNEIQSLGWGQANYLGTTDAGQTSGPFSFVGSGPNGTIVFDSPLTGDYVFVLKASNQFSLYLFRNLVDATQLTYTSLGTSVNWKNSPQGLSHASMYAVVPEPSTWILLGTGLMALGVVAWRRKRQDDAA